MRKLINRLGISSIIAAGAVVGGAAVAGVMAAIPDGSGTIHGCYRTNSGSLRVIDSVTQVCQGNEQSLTWPSGAQQSGSGPSLYTESGETLGTLLDANNFNVGNQQITVYNAALNRVVPLNYNIIDGQPLVDAGYATSLIFESTDCTGAPTASADALFPAKTGVFRAKQATTTYWTVADGAQKTTLLDNSALQDDGTCAQRTGTPYEGYRMTQVTLPFATPIVGALHF